MLQAMRAAAMYQARRVARTLKLALQDREDVEQDTLLVLLERRRFFDPTRGPWVPFAHQIARQAAQSVADRLVAARKLIGVAGETATARNEPQAATIGDAVPDDRAPNEAGMLDAMSLSAFVRTLPVELRLVAGAKSRWNRTASLPRRSAPLASRPASSTDACVRSGTGWSWWASSIEAPFGLLGKSQPPLATFKATKRSRAQMTPWERPRCRSLPNE